MSRDDDRNVSATAAAMAEELEAALIPSLRAYARHLASGDHTLEDVGGVERVAEVVRHALPRANRFADRIGPVYTTGQLQRLLAGPDEITDEAVRARRTQGRLVGVKTADGRWAWPAFQFRVAPGRLVPRDDVLALWNVLPWRDGHLDDVTLVAWLRGPRRDLDGATPLEWLERHGLDEALRRAAGRVRRRSAA